MIVCNISVTKVGNYHHRGASRELMQQMYNEAHPWPSIVIHMSCSVQKSPRCLVYKY